MRRSSLSLAALCLASGLASFASLLIASPARAQEAAPEAAASDAPAASGPPTTPARDAAGPGDDGVQLGIRSGFALPFGKFSGAASSKSLSDDVSAQIPIVLDVGARLSRHWYVGAYGGLGVDLLATAACPGMSCSATSYRAGVDVHYHISPDASFDPWFGAGVGYEWFTASGFAGDAAASATARGFAPLDLQLGGDVRIGRAVHVGPFASLAFGEFRDVSSTTNGMTTSGTIDDTATHMWLTLGARGRFDL